MRVGGVDFHGSVGEWTWYSLYGEKSGLGGDQFGCKYPGKFKLQLRTYHLASSGLIMVALRL